MAARKKEELTELQALEILVEALEQLDEEARQRVIHYLWDRFCPSPSCEEEG